MVAKGPILPYQKELYQHGIARHLLCKVLEIVKSPHVFRGLLTHLLTGSEYPACDMSTRFDSSAKVHRWAHTKVIHTAVVVILRTFVASSLGEENLCRNDMPSYSIITPVSIYSLS